jgi:hypothetical protein
MAEAGGEGPHGVNGATDLRVHRLTGSPHCVLHKQCAPDPQTSAERLDRLAKWRGMLSPFSITLMLDGGTTTRRSSSRRPPGGRRALWLAIGLAGSLGALAPFVIDRANAPDPALVATIVTTRPQRPDRLSPQLHDYVLAKVEWVDQKIGDPERHRTLGRVYEANGLWQEAYDSFANALTLDPDHALTEYHTARSLIGMGRMDEAEAMLAAIVEGHPGLAPAACLWGELLLDRGRFEKQ